jgi:hypothetical protein
MLKKNYITLRGFEQGTCSNSYDNTHHPDKSFMVGNGVDQIKIRVIVCLTKVQSRFNYGICVDTENIGTHDYSYDNYKKYEKDNNYCSLSDGICDPKTNKCTMQMKFKGHNFVWDEYSQSSDNFMNANGVDDGDIPREKYNNSCRNIT